MIKNKLNMNNLEQKIQIDLVSAMKSRDEIRTNAIKSIKTSIMETKTAKNGKKELDDSDIIKIISKLAKERKETGEVYQNNNRQDLADVEFGELKVLETYLPKMLSDEEVEKIIDQTISELGATTVKDMGKVIGTVNKTYVGQVDGKKVSEIVKKKLTN
ncbi:MAG: GatB/YqeY domain-containing protein [Lachnospiraceae bacterium]|nr:GatB/YqeY domain-containing protein [Lachnospiraceae bacterium]